MRDLCLGLKRLDLCGRNSQLRQRVRGQLCPRQGQVHHLWSPALALVSSSQRQHVRLRLCQHF